MGGPERGAAAWPYLISAGYSVGIRPAVVPGLFRERSAVLNEIGDQVRPISSASAAPQAVRPSSGPGFSAAYQTVTATTDGRAYLWDRRWRSGGAIRVLSGHSGRVSACAFSPDGELLATASWDHTVRIWRTRTGEPVTQLTGHAGWVSGVAFTPDGRVVLSTAWDGTVRAWDVASGRNLQTRTMSEPLVTGSALVRHGLDLVTAGTDHVLRVLDLTGRGPARDLLSGHSDEITAVAASPDGAMFATASRDRRVLVWGGDRPVKLQELRGHTDWVGGVAFSPSGQTLISCGWDGTVRAWERNGSQRVLVQAGEVFNGCAISPRGDWFMTAGTGGFHTWRMRDGKPMLVHAIDSGMVQGCAMSRDGRFVAMTSVDDGSGEGYPISDNKGRPIVMHEGLVFPGEGDRTPLTQRDLYHLHATGLSGLGRLLASDAYGGETFFSRAVSIPGWTGEGS